MEINALQYQMPVKGSDIKPNKYYIEVVAVGNRHETDAFYKYVRDYRKDKQDDIVEVNYEVEGKMGD